MIITKATYIISSPSPEACPMPDRPEYAFIGRSNVGKSSLINMIVGRQQLAKTSGTPGKTQLINHFDIRSKRSDKSPEDRWYLVDLPGIGYAKVAQTKRKSWSAMTEQYLRRRPNLANVFMLVDSRHEPQRIDLEFTDKLGEWQVPFALVFTKADKSKPGRVKANVDAYLKKMRETWQFLPASFITSAQEKEGRKEVLDFIDGCNGRFEPS